MIIPKKLKRAVGRRDLIIKEEEGLGNNTNCYGKFQNGNSTIILDANLVQDKKEETFWHEIIEAIDIVNALGLKHNIINILGTNIAQVINSLEEAYGKEIGN